LSGVEFFELIMPDFPDPIRMLLTGHADIDAVIDAINKGQIYKYIAKPWNESELKAMVNEAAMLFHERKAVSDQGAVLLHRMQEARTMALMIQRATGQASGLDADQTAEINRHAAEINRLLAD
jgi:response regulator RpfG family c-di-GMP phosphodiesterase